MLTRTSSLLLAILSLTLAPRTTAQDDLRVMSFNIRYGTAQDGDDAWAHRTQRVTDTIARFRPDILGMQEVLAFQLEFLQQAFPEYVAIGIGRDGERRGEFSPLLVARARFEVRASGTFWLSETPEVVASKGWDAALPRICTWARLREKATARELLVFNTHFDHRGSRARHESARLLAERWNDDASLPRILMGDLNAGEDSAPLDALRAAGMRDAFRIVHPEARVVGTFNGFRGTRTGAKIDHILIDARFDVRSARIDRHHEDSRYPSDHFPVTATLRLEAEGETVRAPLLTGPFEVLAANPVLPELGSDRQEVVDHAVFQAADGSWQLWACIRHTQVGRLLYRWNARTFEQRPYDPVGIAMRADARFGESLDDWGGQEWIQAPHVIRHDGAFDMVYGGHRSENGACQICLATSRDGLAFTRRRDEHGHSRVFVGPGEARDPMVIRDGDRWIAYYAGHDEGHRAPCKVYARTSNDLVRWSEPIVVNFGGSAGHGNWSAECPFVVQRDGAFYLLRTSSYRVPLTHVYRSKDPLDFGRDDDSKKVGTIAVAAPEIVRHEASEWITSVHEPKRGVQIAPLGWRRASEVPGTAAFLARFEGLFDFESGTLEGWQLEGDAFAQQPTFAEHPEVRGQWVGPQGNWFVGTYEARPDREAAAGTQQGDAPRGLARSPHFLLPEGRITFLVGGGDDPERAFVRLVTERDGQELARATGHGSNALRRVVWDVTDHAGDGAFLEIVDASSDAWGHINVDDVRIER